MYITLFVPVPTKDMQTPPPSLLRSRHLDIKDVQCAENKDGHTISYHIISRSGAAGVQKFKIQKIQKFGAQKFKILQK